MTTNERITELMAIEAALREDLPASWIVQCVSTYDDKTAPDGSISIERVYNPADGSISIKRVYKPGYRWIAVTTPWASFDISVARGTMSVQFSKFHRFEIGMEVPDSLEQLSRAILHGAVAYRDATQVGN